MNDKGLLKFSLVIPARNESEHIAATIERCLSLEYPEKELIVVDDSTDETPDIVRQFAGRGVRLFHRTSNRNGCCGARNLGMQNATGDIVVIVNADVRPRSDFLLRLNRYYSEGADFVVPFSNAVNTENPWARYIHAQELEWRERTDMLWAEGFSCRREAAERVGYIPGDFSVPFCRDWVLGLRLQENGYARRVAADILVDHLAHDKLGEFWRVRVARASWTALHMYVLAGLTPRWIAWREAARVVKHILLTATLVVPLRRALALSRRVGRRYVGGLLVGELVSEAATVVGSVRGIRRLRGELRGQRKATVQPADAPLRGE